MTSSNASAPVRPRRSALYVPGSNRRALDKARTLAADALIFDLEDAVAPDSKVDARRQVTEAIASVGYGGCEIVIRVNAYGTRWWDEDMKAAVASGADAMLVPKVDSPDKVSKFGDLMAINGAPDDMQLWIMAETPEAILNIDAIAAADPRLTVIVMGTADLAKALRLPPDPDRSGLRPALGACVLAARARGLDILDGVYGDFSDGRGFAAACEQGSLLGFDGKTLIHPGQIGAANAVFGVSEAEAAGAEEIVRAWEQAASRGSGIAVLDGRMIEELHAQAARRTLDLAEAIRARGRE
ncbi:MAG: HpcH/HpaI aldolase/citrate lyase family protein [Gammaproteobacteria bacterium]